MLGGLLNKKGFTLIEMLVVIVVLGILGAISYPFYLNVVEKSRYAEAKAYLGSLRSHIQQYKLENGKYPADTLPDRRISQDIPWSTKNKNPWGSPYDYNHWSVGNGLCQVQVETLGPDRFRNYKPHTLQQTGIVKGGDDYILSLDVYQCDTPVGAIN